MDWLRLDVESVTIPVASYAFDLVRRAHATHERAVVSNRLVVALARLQHATFGHLVTAVEKLTVDTHIVCQTV